MDRKAFGERLAQARERAGMTQAQLGGKVGVSRIATVSAWETGDSLPKGQAMYRIVTVLGIDGHWLLTGAGRMEPESNQEIEAFRQIAAIVDAVRSSVPASDEDARIADRAVSHRKATSDGGEPGSSRRNGR